MACVDIAHDGWTSIFLQKCHNTVKRLGHSNVTVDGPQIFEVVETDTDIAAASLPRTKVL
jgi:hypothetical protein